MDDEAQKEFLALPNKITIEVIGVEVNLLFLNLIMLLRLFIDVFLSLNLLMLVLALNIIIIIGPLIGTGTLGVAFRASFSL